MCADLRFAAEDSRIGQPEILLGIIPGAGGTQRAPRLCGAALALDLNELCLRSGAYANACFVVGIAKAGVIPGAVVASILQRDFASIAITSLGRSVTYMIPSTTSGFDSQAPRKTRNSATKPAVAGKPREERLATVNAVAIRNGLGRLLAYQTG